MIYVDILILAFAHYVQTSLYVCGVEPMMFAL